VKNKLVKNKIVTTKKFKDILYKNNELKGPIYAINQNRERNAWRTQLNYDNPNL